MPRKYDYECVGFDKGVEDMIRKILSERMPRTLMSRWKNKRLLRLLEHVGQADTPVAEHLGIFPDVGVNQLHLCSIDDF